MSKVQQPVALRARYLFPIASPPIRDAMIVVNNGEILAVGPAVRITRQFDMTPIDLGEVILLPGLVNAHTHLEFSDLTKPLGQPGMAFTDWIRQVMSFRRERAEPDTGTETRIITGIRELIQTGTAAVGEIATNTFVPEGFPLDHLVSIGKGEQSLLLQNQLSAIPRVTAFFELIGLSAERIESAKALAVAYCAPDIQRSFWQMALSPHAPYSCHLNLLTWVCEQSAANKFPVAMHLSETREELQLLHDGTGAFKHLLEEFGVWNSTAFPAGRIAKDYLEVLAKADRALVVHGNYLTNDEIAFLGTNRQRMSVVFCPRTHAFFQHDDYHLRFMLRSGVRVALGTDSRASNSDLSVWQEARHVARQFPDIAAEHILEMITINGAEALGLEEKLGSLQAGKLTHLNYLTMSKANEKLTAEDLLHHPDVPRNLAFASNE